MGGGRKESEKEEEEEEKGEAWLKLKQVWFGAQTQTTCM